MAPPESRPVPRQIDEETEADRKMDPEVRLLGQLLRMLRDVNEASQTRIVRYLADRFIPLE